MAENAHVVQVFSWQIAQIVYYLVLSIITPNFIILRLTVRWMLRKH